MIGELISVVDRLIQLKKYRDVRLQTIFEKVIDPAFNGLLMVQKDYVAMFEEVLSLLEVPQDVDLIRAETEKGGTIPGTRARLHEVIELLRKRRTEFEPARRSLQALSNALSELHLTPELLAFVYAFRDYFPTGMLVDADPRTKSCILLDALYGASGELPPVSWDWIIAITWGTVIDCRRHWSEVCERYAQLKLAVYSRP